MKTKHVIAAIAGLGLGLAVWSGAGAQVTTDGGPYMVGADTWHADGVNHIQYFDGRVEVTQGDKRLRADHVKITHTAGSSSDGGDSNGWGEIVTIEATGNVYYVTPNEQMKGDNALYTKSADTMVITGDVVLQQGQNVMTGDRLTTIVSTGTSTFDAEPNTSNHGRVHAVFYPDSKSANAAANKAGNGGH